MPTPDCQVLDPRIRRTRQFLHDALRQLMLTRNFDEISVHDCLAQWFGLPTGQLATVFPNLANFGSTDLGFFG